MLISCNSALLFPLLENLFALHFHCGYNLFSSDSLPFLSLSLKVGLLGLGRSLQKDLNRIAEVADTSTPEGLSYVLTGKDSLC